MTVLLDDVLADARSTLDQLRAELVADRGEDSHWTGTLSASALSTATAVSALSIVHRHAADPAIAGLIARGCRFLTGAQNADGGFGDTDRSHSNIATTMLVIAALRLAGLESEVERSQTVREAEAYVSQAGGIAALRRRYGKDKTFVIPILTNCALAEMVPWSEVQALPFEVAAVPQSWYRRMRMPVVSYAIPALVAIGQARLYHAPPRTPLLGALRRRLVPRTMAVLQRMQPASGGYLEATPLTSFVLMSLASTGRADHPVSRQAVRFLKESVLEDGSWPIDTNLATWVTSLSIHALASDPADDRSWANESLIDWLLGCQHTERHPFTGAVPGGWGWTDLSGAVPDGDDTPAAMLALTHILDSPRLGPTLRQRIGEAVDAGAQWLLQLQNRDGGWPTFCRGWGRLPFDRSSTDLTAHALRALRCRPPGQLSSPELRNGRQRAVQRGEAFLRKTQRGDGSWLPLWFGNQDNFDDQNPAYGTGRALLAARVDQPQERAAALRAADFLVRSQNADGGWGGGPSLTDWMQRDRRDARPGSHSASAAGWSRGQNAGSEPPSIEASGGEQGPAERPVTSSIEETAIALEGMASLLAQLEIRRPGGAGEGGGAVAVSTGGGVSPYRLAIIRAVKFLCEAVREDRHHDPWPIGFYFAKLWYHERLYPTIFATAALGTAIQVLMRSASAIPRDVERV